MLFAAMVSSFSCVIISLTGAATPSKMKGDCLMYLKLRFKCECGSKFEIDNEHSNDRMVVCPNCGYTATCTGSGSHFKHFMNSVRAFDLSDTKISVEKIRVIPQ